ncbi:MAG: MarR family transcriptional regulator [Proteobacteria bacterium]|nr:MarR family transcriptional regulator [Pseudomonadota bacterium]
MDQKSFTSVTPDEFKDILFSALRSVYKFERLEVLEFGLTLQQIYLLKFLKREGPVTIGKIAEEMEMKIFSATRLVDQLVEKGLILKKRYQSDKRNVFARLSRHGERMVGQIETHAVSSIMKNMDGFDAEEVAAILFVCTKLNTILNGS